MVMNGYVCTSPTTLSYPTSTVVLNIYVHFLPIEGMKLVYNKFEYFLYGEGGH